MNRVMKSNKMLMHAFILVTILATAKSAEAEITMEAAFQGHCGHTSPCEQLCYEIHDGMYECDCIEGYELNKNGYSCQVINSTSSAGDAHSKSDEDVLYQKGASFSAKLANNNNNNNNNNINNNNAAMSATGAGITSSTLLSAAAAAKDDASVTLSAESNYAAGADGAVVIDDDDNDGDETNGIDSYFIDNDGVVEKADIDVDVDAMDGMSKQRQEVNSNDYYISAESINFSNELPDSESESDIGTEREYNGDSRRQSVVVPSTTSKVQTDRGGINKPKTVSYNAAQQKQKQQQLQLPHAEYMEQEGEDEGEEGVDGDEYFQSNKPEDMSIYDDVNNNQLNLRPLSQAHHTYQAASASTSQPPPSLSSSSTILYKHNNNNNNNNNINNNNNNNNNNGNDNDKSKLKHNEATASPPSYPTHYEHIQNISNNNGSISSSSSTAACTLDCGGEGQCDNSVANQPRCLCPFGKTGGNCNEEIKVRVPKFSQKSWLAFPALRGAYKHVQLRVEFRPESFDGIILLSGERDDLTGDFMALLLNKGFVEFWFDCGSGMGSVRSRETILLNEWNSVIIYRHRWDAWLVLNHGSKVQGRSNGLFSRITFREPVFLGGTGNITGLSKRLPVVTGFVGCIRRFVANEHDYKFEEHPLGDVTKGFDIQDCITDKCFKYPCQHGGKCLPSDQGAVCLCPIGFVGDLCEIRMDLQVPAFNGSSFLRYAPLGDNALIWLELKVIFKTEQPDGLILYSGPEKHGDFIALALSDGFVEFTFDLGSGPAVVRSEYPLSIGQWHTVQVSRTARLAVMKIDQMPELMTISSNGFWHLSLPEHLFLGGVNHVDKLPLDLKFKPFFVGCIQKIDINGHSLGTISEALGGTNIGNCPHACVARPCGPLAECVPQMESYECRCSALNAQCNKAAEVPLEELQLHKAKEQQQQQQQQQKQQQQQQQHKKQNVKANEPKRALHGGKVKSELKANKAKATTTQKHTSKMHSRKTTTTTTTTTQLPSTTTTTPFALNRVMNKQNKKQKHHQQQQQQHQYHQSSIERSDFVDEKRVRGLDDMEDDIIFRDVHGMHKKFGHGTTEQRRVAKSQRNVDSIASTEETVDKPENNNNNNNNGKKKLNSNGKSHQYAHGTKFNPHHKHAGAAYSKLSRLPTHYESFQTNPEGSILTFGENVDVRVPMLPLPTFIERQNDHGHDHGSTSGVGGDSSASSSSSSFVIDESLFDDSDDDASEEYHRKQLAQDMRRIMANAPDNTHGSENDMSTTTATNLLPTSVPVVDKLILNEYEDLTDYPQDSPSQSINDFHANDNDQYFYSDEDSRSNEQNDNDQLKKMTVKDKNDNKQDNFLDLSYNENTDEDDEDVADNDDDLLEPVQQLTAAVPELSSVPLHGASTTPQTQTDWSLLKKLELSADQQSQFIGVRKNFGACFAGRDSYFHYNDAETMSQIISYNIDLNLRIKTHSHDGVILWTGRQGSSNEDDGDYLSLGIENGFLHFRYDLGSGEVDIMFNLTKVSDGLWHRVRAIRNSQEGYLEVDGRKTSTLHAPGKLRQLNTDTGLYVGGVPELSYFTRRKYSAGIVGCISEIVLAGELKLNFDPNTLGTAHNVETGIL